METTKMQDAMASIVHQRWLRARDIRRNHIVHQGKSFESLMERADLQYSRTYSKEESDRLRNAFGFCPSRYYGLTQIKVNATRAWKRDLVINHMDSILQCIPTPEPELDEASLARIRRGVQEDLRKRIVELGGGNPQMLLTAQGRTAQIVEDNIREQVRQLKKVEQSRIVSTATEAAKRAQIKLTDNIVQSGFRNAYGRLTHNQLLYGLGFGRFPYWKRKSVLNWKGNKPTKSFELIPTFCNINPRDMYVITDSDSMEDNTANIQLLDITKMELVAMAGDKRYDKAAIEWIIEEYTGSSRNWLIDTGDTKTDDYSVYWGPDEPIKALVMEGYVSGSDLKEMGVTGYDNTTTLNVHVVVVGGRTILLEHKALPSGVERTFFGIPFNRFGDNIYDVLGIAAQLYDSESRVNALYHTFEHNVDWATRPPLMKNSSVFQNPAEANSIAPGKQYEIEDMFATSGSMPEPIRQMNGVSAQYHLVMSEINSIIRSADEECGVPAFAYGAQDMGRASLGEYSQRMSNALRVVKEAAIEEDTALEPAWRALFRHLMLTDKNFAEGQDVDLSFRGMSGLLAEDLAMKQKEAMIPLVQAGVDRQVLPKQVEEYAFRQVLDPAGFPLDELGLSNPMLDKAAAIAAQQPTQGLAPGGQQVPQLDGRSGAIPRGAVAAPNGASTY